MHTEARQWVEKILECLPKFSNVLEVGSYDVNGSIKPVVQRISGAPNYTGIDLREGPGVDIVVDGAEYDFDQKFDAVISCETLEHAPNADEVIANAYRLLKRGGYFVATMATHPRSPHTNDGDKLVNGFEFYRNISPWELAEWCGKFRQVSTWVHEGRGDLYLVARK
jgi:SAM-dependent methyltransferase